MTKPINLYEDKVYRNRGNQSVLRWVPDSAKRILDIGCGAGDNARILTDRGCRVTGVTLSIPEAELAKSYCESVLVANAEFDPLPFDPGSFDVLLFSHVLEHTVDPGRVLSRLEPFLTSDGVVLIAVPNVAQYRYRWRVLRGNWQGEETGAFDRTHLHYWSYETADRILDGSPFVIRRKIPGDPSMPLWPLRRLAPSIWLSPIDRLTGRWFPNLTCLQTVIIAGRPDQPSASS